MRQESDHRTFTHGPKRTCWAPADRIPVVLFVQEHADYMNDEPRVMCVESFVSRILAVSGSEGVTTVALAETA